MNPAGTSSDLKRPVSPLNLHYFSIPASLPRLTQWILLFTRIAVFEIKRMWRQERIEIALGINSRESCGRSSPPGNVAAVIVIDWSPWVEPFIWVFFPTTGARSSAVMTSSLGGNWTVVSVNWGPSPSWFSVVTASLDKHLEIHNPQLPICYTVSGLYCVIYNTFCVQLNGGCWDLLSSLCFHKSQALSFQEYLD